MLFNNASAQFRPFSVLECLESVFEQWGIKFLSFCTPIYFQFQDKYLFFSVFRCFTVFARGFNHITLWFMIHMNVTLYYVRYDFPNGSIINLCSMKILNKEYSLPTVNILYENLFFQMIHFILTW